MGVGVGAIRAGLAVVELSADLGPLMGALNQAVAGLKGFAAQVGGIGARVGGLGASIVQPILGQFHAAIEGAAAMDTLGTQLGMTAERASRLTYALGTVGIGEGELVGFARHMNSAFASAADGSQEAVQSFARLGLNWQALAQMPLEDRLIAVSDALKNVTNDFDRSTQAAHFFGRRGQELLKLPTGELQRRMAEAGDVGAVVSPEQAAQARELQRAFSQMSSAIKYAFLEVGRALLPSYEMIKEYSGYVVMVARGVREWIADNKELVIGVLALGGGLAAAGAALVALGVLGSAAWSGLTIGAGVVAAAWSVGAALIAGTWTALGAIGGVVVSGITLAWKLGSALVTAAWTGGAGVASAAWVAAQAVATAGLSLLATAAAAVILPLIGAAAVGIAVVGGYLAAQTSAGRAALAEARSIGRQIRDDAMNVWNDVRESAVAAWGGIQSAFKRGDWSSVWQITAAAAAVAWASIRGTFLNYWDSIIDFGRDSWGRLVVWFQAAFSRGVAGIFVAFNSIIQRMLLTMSVVVAQAAGTRAAQALGVSERGTRLSETLREASEGVGRMGDQANDWADQRVGRAERALELARAARAAATAETRERREAAVEEARQRLAGILAEERARDEAGRRRPAGEGGAASPSVALSQAAREVRGTFQGFSGGGAQAQQMLAVGSTVAQRQLVETQRQTGILTEIRNNTAEGGARFG